MAACGWCKGRGEWLATPAIGVIPCGACNPPADPIADRLRANPPAAAGEGESCLARLADRYAETILGRTATRTTAWDDGVARTSSAGVASDLAAMLARRLALRGSPWRYRGIRWEAGAVPAFGQLKLSIDGEGR